MLRGIILACFFSFLIANGMAQDSLLVAKQLKLNGEAYILLPNVSPGEMSKIYKHLSVDKYNPHTQTATVYVNPAGFEWLRNHHFEYKLLTSPGMLSRPTMAYEASQMADWNAYPTYALYLQMMQKWADDYPSLCKLDTIGTSNTGKLILALKISDYAALDEAETEFFYTSSMHGDETTGYVLMLRLIDFLLKNYNTDPRATEILNNMEVWINPLSNPDGTYRLSDTSLYGATRGNFYGIDINRNFKDPEDGDHPDGNAWQTETLDMMDYMQKRNFTMSANFHGGTEVLNYPWDTYYARHPEDAWFQHVCHEYADTSQTQDALNYLGYDDGITNGYDWYSVAGGRQDYSTFFCHSREVTIEISNTKLLPADQLPLFWDYNYRSFLNFMLAANKGVTGIVRNAQNGQALADVLVKLPNADTLNSWVYTDANGYFMRPLLPGKYQLAVYKPGFLAQVINTQFSNWTHNELNIDLQAGNNAPFASDTAGYITDTLHYTTLENTPGRFCNSIIDFENENIYIKQVVAKNGTATTAKNSTFCIQYTPNNGFLGTDTLLMTVCDLPGNCRVVTILMRVILLDSTDKIENQLNIYPNPAQDYVFGTMPENENIQKLHLYNAAGMTMQAEYQINGNHIYIKTNHLKDGIYMGKLITQSAVRNFKFIVKH